MKLRVSRLPSAVAASPDAVQHLLEQALGQPLRGGGGGGGAGKESAVGDDIRLVGLTPGKPATSSKPEVFGTCYLVLAISGGDDHQQLVALANKVCKKLQLAANLAVDLAPQQQVPFKKPCANPHSAPALLAGTWKTDAEYLKYEQAKNGSASASATTTTTTATTPATEPVVAPLVAHILRDLLAAQKAKETAKNRARVVAGRKTKKPTGTQQQPGGANQQQPTKRAQQQQQPAGGGGQRGAATKKNNKRGGGGGGGGGGQ